MLKCKGHILNNKGATMPKWNGYTFKIKGAALLDSNEAMLLILYTATVTVQLY